jgi:SOS response regulatory protein OraA/RecX
MSRTGRRSRRWVRPELHDHEGTASPPSCGIPGRLERLTDVAPIVTELRRCRSKTIEIELDGSPWRRVPEEVVIRVGVEIGMELDRRAAVSLGRALREHRALSVALGALHYRDHTSASLSSRLERRGVRNREREGALATLERAGLLSDRRFAVNRAVTLAERAFGDAAIRQHLERAGVPGDLVQEALVALEPEAARAERFIHERGLTVKTLRALAARGFAEESLEPAVAALEEQALA